MQAWVDFIQRQEAAFGASIVDKWLRSLKVVHFDSGNLYLEAKDSFQVMWFEEHMRPLLKAQLLNSNFRPIKVHLTVAEAPASVKPSKKEKDRIAPPLIFDKLDPSMTLDNFIPGESNRVSLRLLRDLTSPAAFNPIYLWGSPGCGKTHLLMALAQAFRSQGVNALYARAETFTEHVVAAIRSSEMQPFRKAYRHADVLLIDGIHIFARKDATQEEFFHTFNTLHTSGRQIILSAAYPPALLEGIEPRLVSRFEWGINIHIEKLKKEELKGVLAQRSEALHFPLSEETASFLVETFQSAQSLHRSLEALVLRSHTEGDARYRRSSELIGPADAQRMLNDLIIAEQKSVLTVDKIIAAVSQLYGMRAEDILSKSQAQDCSLPRQLAMYLCRRELKLPFQTIGEKFGRDHSTVMTGVKQIEKKLESKDAELLASLTEIQNRLAKAGYKD